MKILNLYAGLGGNRKLWQNVKVTAVENNKDVADAYLINNPDDEIVIGDAHKYLLERHDEFDFVCSSPPCQSHSKMMKATRHNVKKYPDLKLYEEIIFLQHFFKGKFVVENVKPYYQPLIKPVATFGRHFFWSNFYIPPMNVPKQINIMKGSGKEYVEQLKSYLGIKYEKYIYFKGDHDPAKVLRNCVHPELGLHILNRAQRSSSKQRAKTDSSQLSFEL